MFGTIGHTIELMKTSAGVLGKERSLLAFPALAGISLLIVGAIALGIGTLTGSVARATGPSGPESGRPVDFALGVATLFAVYLVVTFFNSGLVASALARLRGEDTDVGHGLSTAGRHLPAIAGWALISAVVGTFLRGRKRGLARLAVGIVGGIWAYVTFLVVPVLVAEGVGPMAAIKRSGALLRETWGRQVTAAFGFGFVYLASILVAAVPAILLFTVDPILGVAVGVILVPLAMAVVAALEGVFKAALYEYATGETPREYDADALRAAYRPTGS